MSSCPSFSCPAVSRLAFSAPPRWRSLTTRRASTRPHLAIICILLVDTPENQTNLISTRSVSNYANCIIFCWVLNNYLIMICKCFKRALKNWQVASQPSPMISDASCWSGLYRPLYSRYNSTSGSNPTFYTNPTPQIADTQPTGLPSCTLDCSTVFCFFFITFFNFWLNVIH